MEVQGEVDGSGVPLAVLLKRELCNQRVEKPDMLFGEASKSKKGKDVTFLLPKCCRRPGPVEGDGENASGGGGGDDDTISVFAIFDGHNGSAAAIYTRENLLNNALAAIPPNLTSEEWTTSLPRALVAGFVKTDKEFQTKVAHSGTTVTFVIIDGWVVTAASVGDSRCILESVEGSVYFLSADHCLDSNEEEVERVTASGGDVGQIDIAGEETTTDPYIQMNQCP